MSKKRKKTKGLTIEEQEILRQEDNEAYLHNKHYTYEWPHSQREKVKKDNTLGSTVLSGEDYKVYILPTVLNQIQQLVAHFDTEVCAIGGCVVGKGYLLIKKLYVPRQEVSGVECTMLPESITEIVRACRKEGLSPKYHVHSHVNMQAYFSATDIALYKGLCPNNYMIASVFNKSHESVTGLFMQRKLGDKLVMLYDETLELEVWTSPTKNTGFIAGIKDKVIDTTPDYTMHYPRHYKGGFYGKS